jgi:hypothetical protein
LLQSNARCRRKRAPIPEFAAALREARDLADARVARSLFARAVGYSHKVDRTVLHRGEALTISNIVHYPPDTQACIFWLRNLRRRTWGEKAPTEGFHSRARGRRREHAQCRWLICRWPRAREARPRLA